jgi:hypothetical protein
VLKPETSSDSASEKSKGARWVSAKVQINHKGRRRRKRGEESCKELRIEKDISISLIKTIKVLKTDS